MKAAKTVKSTKTKKVEEKLRETSAGEKTADFVEEEIPARKRGSTHIGRHLVDNLRKQNEQAKEEIERLRKEIEMLSKTAGGGSSSAIKEIQRAIDEGGVLVEIDPSAVVVGDHDRQQDSLRDASFSRLVNSIREHGQLVPIVVRPRMDGRFDLVAGFRRLNAAKLLGQTIMAVATEVTDSDLYMLKLIENEIREDLNPFEKADSIAKVMEKKGLNARQMGEALSVSHVHILNTLHIARIPQWLRKYLTVETISKRGRNDQGELLILFPAKSRLTKIGRLFSDLTDEQQQQLKELVQSPEYTSLSDPDKRAQVVIARIDEMISAGGKRTTREKIIKKAPIKSDGKTIGAIEISSDHVRLRLPRPMPSDKKAVIANILSSLTEDLSEDELREIKELL